MKQTEQREQRLEAWMNAYGTAVLRTCFVYLSDAAQAEDAMQETFLKAWRKMDQFDGRNGCSEKTWLMKIAINVCRDYRRSQWFRRTENRFDIESMSALAVPPEERLLMLDILRMPDQYKQVLLLYYYQNLTLEETAKALRLSRSTVQYRLKQAEALLKNALSGGNAGETANSANH